MKGSGNSSCRQCINIGNINDFSIGDKTSPESIAKTTMLGLACGDAIGLTSEITSNSEKLLKKYKISKVEGFIKKKGNFQGVYSDDTQQSLSIARCINPDGTFNPERFTKEEIPYWQEYAKGWGYTSSVSSKSLASGKDWYNNFYHETIKDRHGSPRNIEYRKSNSNGTVMRIAPLALANLNRPEQLYNETWKASVCTHGHPSSVLSAATQAEAIRFLATSSSDVKEKDLISHLQNHIKEAKIPENPEINKWLENWSQGGYNFQATYDVSKQEILQGLEDLKSLTDNPKELAQFLVKYKACTSPYKTQATPTILNSLAIYVSTKGKTKECILASSNLLGSDTDTLAAITASLCNAKDAGQTLPSEWISEVQDKEYIASVGRDLAQISQGTAKKSPGASKEDKTLKNLRELLYQGELKNDMRVNHPLFGAGSVDKSWFHTPKQKSGSKPAKIFYARVLFDNGQSCKFKVNLKEDKLFELPK